MKKIAIVGATGLVGRSILDVLNEENMLDRLNIILYVSDKSAGGTISCHGKTYNLKELGADALGEGFDVVLFSAGEDISKKWAKQFVVHGSFVVDNSSAFRREPEIPLVVPEINMSTANGKSKLISNPNCSTIELVLVLNELLKLAKIEKVVVSTYQSVSGAGSEALSDLCACTNHVFKDGIKDNLITQIGEINDLGYCTEEDKLMFETSKILNQKIDLSATTIRIPTPYCHGESVYVKLDHDIKVGEFEAVLESANIKVSKCAESLLKIHNTNDVYVSRIRKAGKGELLFYVIADNLRRGASYNAVMIAKNIISQYLGGL